MTKKTSQKVTGADIVRYQKAVAFLEGLSNLPLDGDYMIGNGNLEDYLHRMEYFLSLIGNPHHGFKYIHVTGTSGKGSVTNMLHNTLQAADKKVGSYTSPFVTTTIEKIKVNDLFISPESFADIVDELKPAIDEAYQHGTWGRPSYFELCLAIAFIYFKKQKCEWVVLEVGCGGRYDATNVIQSPIVTAITNVDLDHTHLLGKTRSKIARDKAGIIKPGSVFFTSESRPHIKKIFKDICHKLKVSYNEIPYQENYKERNSGLVAAIAQYLKLPQQAIEAGLSAQPLQCRFETMQTNPLVILDGAHNPAKVATTVHNLTGLSYNKLHVIIGMAENKHAANILKEIIPLADQVYITRFQIKDRKCAHPRDILKAAKPLLKKGVKADIFLDPHQALTAARTQAHKHDLILSVGSFFLAGDLRQEWIPEITILKHRQNY